MLRKMRCKTMDKEKVYRKMQRKALREEVKQLKKTMKHSETLYYSPFRAEIFEEEQRKETQLLILNMMLNTLEIYNCEASKKLSKDILWISEQIIKDVSGTEEMLDILIKRIQVFTRVIKYV